MNIILTLPICSAGFSAWLSPIGTVPKDFNPEDGQISVYKFHYDPNILAYCFQGASVEWLHFVAENRKKDLFPQLLKKYGTIDIIGGKIADDQTAHTLQQYIGGVRCGLFGHLQFFHR